MKNQIILIAAAAMAFASCSKDETTEVNPGNAIGFRTAVTRATETSTSRIHSMKVTALYTNANTSTTSTYFDALEFTNTVDSLSWVSSPVYYWPTSGTMTFYAWAPSDLTPAITASSTTFEFTPNQTVSQQVDFIAAKLADQACSASASSVQLPFEHALAQIVVKAKNTKPGNIYKVYGVRIGKVAKKGTYDFATHGGTGSWDTQGVDKTTYEITYDDPVVISDATVKSIMDAPNQTVNNAAMLIPQATTEWNKQPDATSNGGSYISVKVQITTETGFQVFPSAAGQSDWVAVPVAFVWSKGNKYTYVLDFKNGAGQVDPSNPDQGGDDVLGGAIDFNVTVSDWGNTTSSTGVDMSNGNQTSITGSN